MLLTDGVDQGSKVSLQSAIETAQRADLVVYSILFADDTAGQGSPRQMERAEGKKILRQISRETGGGFFEVTKKQPIDEIYRRVEEELRNQYSISYSAPKTDDAGYRDIALTTKRKDLVVQAREGYYPAR